MEQKITINGIKKELTDNNMESDHIIIKDSNNNEFEIFWFSHEVIINSKNNHFEFLKKDKPELFNFLTKFAKQVELTNNLAGGQFVENNKFTWHHMSRAWDRAFEEEAGFTATLNKDSIEINFFPSLNKFESINSNKNFFISMGGPDGFVEPYQSISNLFAQTLNILIHKIPCESENQIQKSL